MRLTRIGIGVSALALVGYTESGWACATCFGAEGDPQTEGLNMAIITLLAVTYTLFSGMALMAFFYWRKNRVLPEGEVGDVESPLLEEAPTSHG